MKPNKKAIIAISQIILIIIALIFIFIYPVSKKPEYIRNQGKAQGTYYSVVYLQPEGQDLQREIDSLFAVIDNSLSTFNPNSIISRINRNDTTVFTDLYFETMYTVAQQVSEKTGGAFDITVAPLVNAWGFGFGNRERKQMPDIDTILPYIGYRKIRLENHRLIKDDLRIMLDASAIAKGYSADLIAQLLEAKGCENYMVEIGGEIVCKGKNPKGKKWTIAIDMPIDNQNNTREKFQDTLYISNSGLATSGNYRQFYYLDDKKYSHTIDPRSGYPVSHNLLSLTVIAPTCIQADAFATAFLVMGADSALALCNQIPEIECYLILTDTVKMSDNFK